MVENMRKIAAPPADDAPLEDKADGGGLQSIKVVVRVRPMNSKEQAQKEKTATTVDSGRAEVFAGKPFTFDRAFGPDATQEAVYAACAKNLVENVINGHNATIFAYGQTGEPSRAFPGIVLTLSPLSSR